MDSAPDSRPGPKKVDGNAGSRLCVWRGLDSWRIEAAVVDFTLTGLVASGTQIGSEPIPYRLDYNLDASEHFATRKISVEVRGQGWQRSLDLRRDSRGRWTCRARSEGRVDLPAPGGQVAGLEGALDCDLGFSPLTNSPPILRSGLDRRAGAEDYLMAWVSVPDLSVHASQQRYEHVRRTAGGSVVRFVDRGLFKGFEAELELDQDGLVIRYPGLAERAGE